MSRNGDAVVAPFPSITFVSSSCRAKSSSAPQALHSGGEIPVVLTRLIRATGTKA